MIIRADQDTLTIVEDQEKYSGSRDYYTIAFEFSSDWDDFSARHAVFIRSETEVEDILIPADGIVSMPNAFLEYETVIGVGCYGLSGDIRRTTNLVKVVVDEGSYKAGARAVPTPDIFQQYLDQIIAYAESFGEDFWERIIPAGGTAGQVLAKTSDNDFDVEWKAGGGDVTDDAVTNTSADDRYTGLNNQQQVNEKISADIADKADTAHDHDGM